MTELKKIELSEENLELVSGGVNFKEVLKKIDLEVVSAVISTAALIAGSFVVYKKRDKIKNWFKKDNDSSNKYNIGNDVNDDDPDDDKYNDQYHNGLDLDCY